MNFYTRETRYSEWKRKGYTTKLGIGSQAELIRWYGACHQLSIKDATERERNGSLTLLNELGSEQIWVNHGSPYYKVMPAWLEKLAFARIDIPAESMKTPFLAFVILLPHGNGIYASGGDYELRSMMMTYATTEDAMRECPTTMLGRLAQDRIRATADRHSRLVVAIDYGETQQMEIESNTYWTIDFSIRHGQSVEEAFRQNETEHAASDRDVLGLPIDPFFREICLRLAVSCSLIATGAADRALEYDVLSSDLLKYREADQQTRRKLERKARHRGKYGWIIGRLGERTLPRMADSDAETVSGNRHLRYSHLRAGHFHLYHTGSGRSVPKVRWVDPTPVRPDLPAPPERHTTARVLV